MKTIIALAISFTLCLTTAFAATTNANSGTTTLTGTITDNHCAAAHKDSLGGFTATHTKECVLAPDCAKSGFSLYTNDGLLTAFDKASYAKIQKFLQKPASSLNVVVSGKMGKDGALQVASVKNQKVSPVK